MPPFPKSGKRCLQSWRDTLKNCQGVRNFSSRCSEGNCQRRFEAMSFCRRITGRPAPKSLAAIRDSMSAHRSRTHSFTANLIDLMRKNLRLSSLVTAVFLALCSASGSNAEPDAAIEHAAAPVEAAQGPNMTVVPDRDANVSTAQTENDAAKNLSAVSIAPNTSCDTLNSAAATHGLPLEFFCAFNSAGK